MYKSFSEARQQGSLEAIKQANRILDPVPIDSRSEASRWRVERLAEDLFVSIRMQLSVPLL